MSYYLSNLSLPMLIVFDAVCRKGSMTRAAQDIHISQPAVSRYMKELREITGQDLFIKTTKGTELTETGKVFWRKAVEVLDTCEYFTRYNEHEFNPELQKEHFKIAVSLLNTSYFMEELILNARSSYPLIHIDLIHLNIPLTIKQLEAREISLYLGYDIDNFPSYLAKEPVQDVQFTVVCSRKSPLYKQGYINKKDFIEHPHIKLNTETGESFMDRALTQSHLLQNNLTDVPDMASMLLLLRKTEMLFIAQKEHALQLCDEYNDIQILNPTDFKLPQIKTCMLWNRSNTEYAPHIWLRNHIKSRLNSIT